MKIKDKVIWIHATWQRSIIFCNFSTFIYLLQQFLTRRKNFTQFVYIGFIRQLPCSKTAVEISISTQFFECRILGFC